MCYDEKQSINNNNLHKIRKSFVQRGYSTTKNASNWVTWSISITHKTLYNIKQRNLQKQYHLLSNTVPPYQTSTIVRKH